MNSDLQRLWFSRASFGISAVALLAAVYGGCQDRSSTQLHPVPDSETAVMAAPQAAPAAGGSAIEAPDENAPQAENAPADNAPNGDERRDGASAERGSAKKPLSDSADNGDGLDVKRLVITTEIKNREPVANRAPSGDGAVIAFVELTNGTSSEQHIQITFEHQAGQKVGFVDLKVPGSQTRWRTWGQTRNVKQAGEWAAVVSTQDGRELRRVTFNVDPV